MQYISTNRNAPALGFRAAVFRGQAPDNGLYFPEHIPRVKEDLLKNIQKKSRVELAAEILAPFVGEDISAGALKVICERTFHFDIPLVQLDEKLFVLELFHGPTFAFKDIGAGFLGNCLQAFLRDSSERYTVLTATSGDTGGAVAHSFKQIPSINAVILYPKGKISRAQELQMTTHGENVHAVAVEGDFDDCQRLVKQAFNDPGLEGKLLSANSINIARWISQQVYYWFAIQQWKGEIPPVFVVPSGNLGNLTSGLLAARTGLPASGFIAACNANDVLADYLQGASFRPKPAVETLSTAMDIGNPNNFPRLQQLQALNKALPIKAYSVSDEQTVEMMQELHSIFGYLADPHTAVGIRAFRECEQQLSGSSGIVLSTAHPVKFAETIRSITGVEPEWPAALNPSAPASPVFTTMENNYGQFSAWLKTIV